MIYFKVGDNVKIKKGLDKLQFGCSSGRSVSDHCDITGIITNIANNRIAIKFPFQSGFSVKDYEIEHVYNIPEELFQM